TIEDDCAGSWPMARNTSGTPAPATPAMVIDNTIADPITRHRPADPLQNHTPAIVTTAMASPFNSPTDDSFTTTGSHWRMLISCSVRPRMVTASDCAPVLPD